MRYKVRDMGGGNHYYGFFDEMVRGYNRLLCDQSGARYNFNPSVYKYNEKTQKYERSRKLEEALRY